MKYRDNGAHGFQNFQWQWSC